MASAKFTVPFIKSSESKEDSGKINYNLSEIVSVSGFTSVFNSLTMRLDSDYLGLKISLDEGGYSLSVDGGLYYERVGLIITDEKTKETTQATAYTKVISYIGTSESKLTILENTQGLVKNNWQEIKTGTVSDIVSFDTILKDISFVLGTSTGYGKSEFWDSTIGQGGSGIAFDGSNKDHMFQISKSNEVVALAEPTTESIYLYSTDDNFSKIGNITGLVLPRLSITSLKFFCSNILYIDVDSNLLTSLDISKLTQITFLGLSNNNLKSLDISNQLLLESINIDYNKDISSLDFTGLSKITNVSIRETDIYSTNLDKLLISIDNSVKGGLGGRITLTIDQLASRTPASNVAIDSLRGKGWDISTKGR